MSVMGEETVSAGGAVPSSRRLTGNRVLDALDAEDTDRFWPHLESVLLSPGQVLGQTGQGDPWALFPCGPAVVSVVAVCEDGRTAEALSVGSEGLLGPAITGLPDLGMLQVQMPGRAWRIGAPALTALSAESKTWREGLAAADKAMLVHLIQSAVCASLHPVEARVSRWLLLAMERVGQAELPVTQELLADLLGVRRTTVTRVMAQLTEKGVIRHRRSRVMVADPSGLAAMACTCHAALQRRLRHVAPALYPH